MPATLDDRDPTIRFIYHTNVLNEINVNCARTLKSTVTCLNRLFLKIMKLFESAKKQLEERTLSIRRSVIDQYINKIIIYTDRIEIYINLINDYVLKEVVKAKGKVI